MRSLWLLLELGVEFELKAMPFDLAVLRDEAYLAVHPLGRVPCLIDGEQVIFESGAICEWLCECHDDGVLGRPPGHAERAEWLQWLHYAETVAVHVATLVQQTVFIKPEDRSEVVRKIETRRLEKALEVLDARLAERDYLLSSGFSAVDTNVGYSVHIAGRFVELARYPNLAAYHERLAHRPAFLAALGREDQRLEL